MTIVIAILIFGLLILIHEGGHFLFARVFRVTVYEFAIGMGPKVLSHTSKKTGIAYSLRLLPFGGFVSMAGEDEDCDDENAFCKKPVWQRMIITAAGAAMNLLVGILVMGILVASAKNLPSTVVYQFMEDSTSAQYGLMEDDRITAVEGTAVHTANELVYEVMRKGVEPIDITVRRGGKTVVLHDVAFPTITESGETFGNIDFYVYSETKTPLTVLKHGFFRSLSTIKMIWESLYDLITGRYGMNAVGGPVAVTEAMSEAASEGIADLVYLSVVISMNLGIMNLLPLPALDGGRLMFQLIEAIFRRPVPRHIEAYVHFGGIVVLMALMALITFKDIVGLIK